jgi:hypothetical protein
MSRSHEENHARNRAADALRDQRRVRIRQLNDQLRTTLIGGRLMITSGIRALASDAVADVLRAVSTFADFSADNDPYDEHDFGSVEIGGERVFWKIDYYDKQLEYGSPDPSCPDVTARVLTIMLASEY